MKLLIWLTLSLAAFAEAGDFQIQATGASLPTPGLARLEISVRNLSIRPRRWTVETGTPFSAHKGQGSIVFLAQPVDVLIKPGLSQRLVVPAITSSDMAVTGAYEPSADQQLMALFWLVHEEASGGPGQWPQIAAALRPGPTSSSEVERLRGRLQALEKVREARPVRDSAQAAQAAGQFSEASQLYSQVLLLDPTAGDYLHRAQAKLRLSAFQEALDDAQRALALQPDNQEALVVRASARIYLNDLSGAIVDLDQLIARNPAHDRAYRYRAYVRSRLHAAGVAEDYAASLRLNPFASATYHFRSQWLEEQGDRAAALRDSEQAVIVQPDNTFYLGWRGHLRGLQGDLAGARRDLQQALQINPNNAQARDDLQRWGTP